MVSGKQCKYSNHQMKASQTSFDISCMSDQPYFQNCKNLYEIIIANKDKIQVSSKRSAIRLLTLAPSSWSNKKRRAFEVTSYMVKQARRLKMRVK